MENPNPQAQNNQPPVTKKKKTRIVFWVIVAIIFIIVLSVIYFWNKPFSITVLFKERWYCESKPTGECPKFWCKEVSNPCVDVYEETGIIGECWQPTLCVPR